MEGFLMQDHIHSIIKSEYEGSFVGHNTFSERVMSAPIYIKSEILDLISQRAKHIESYFRKSLEILKSSICGHNSDNLTKLLLNDSDGVLSLEFYRTLPSSLWTIPRFFRTDESASRKIYEIQCPGSGWGDLPLLARVYRSFHDNEWLNTYYPENLISSSIRSITNEESPAVLHLLDNSSNPASMRYLISLTQPPIRYYGYNKTVRSDECTFIRSHSVRGLIGENLFYDRIRKCADGKLKFDLPPIMLFDQKITMCLPFLDETRSRFSDVERDLFVYSYPITKDGFRDENGEWVTIDAFVKMPRNKRKYVLKYGGGDTSINWGGRSVYRLDGTKSNKLIYDAVNQMALGRPWIIQPIFSEKEKIDIGYYNQDEKKTMTAKYSAFYGPDGLIGIRTMHRQDYKVHGQEDTIIGLAIKDDRQQEVI